MSRHPEVKWAQRLDKVYITVLLADSKSPKVDLDPDGTFTFSATAGPENHPYELKLELSDKVNVEESKLNVGVRNAFCVIEKAEKGWWKKLLRGDGKTPHYVKVDWDKWVDEDEDNGPPENSDMGGMDFSKFGGMDGLGGDGGMGGLGGMGGMGGMDFSKFGGMEGMGGMGGMDFSKFAGMEGLGAGAGDFPDDEEDDEDTEVSKPPHGHEAEKTEEAAPKT